MKNLMNLYDCMNSKNEEEVGNELIAQIALEDLLLQSLHITKENSQSIYMELKNSLEESLFDHYRIELRDKKLEEMMKRFKKGQHTSLEQENDLILKRFESYIIHKMKPLPLKSEKDGETGLIEDSATIKHQAKLDYYATVIQFLEEDKTTGLQRDLAIHTRNQILLKEKEIERDYIDGTLEPNRRTRCVTLGHDEALVDDIYYDFITDMVNENGNRCFIFPNSTLQEEKESARFHTILQLFKAGLYLLDTEDVKEITMNYECTFMNSPKESVKEMKKAMKQVIAKKEGKEINGPVKQKKLGE